MDTARSRHTSLTALLHDVARSADALHEKRRRVREALIVIKRLRLLAFLTLQAKLYRANLIVWLQIVGQVVSHELVAPLEDLLVLGFCHRWSILSQEKTEAVLF